ncbi:MAG: efflux RND transporter permease subunit [Candidatus Eisenbacteria bacterium]
MLERLMRIGLKNRLIVLLAAAGMVVLGILTISNIPIDVFPDLTAPTVTVMTEAHGMAPEEVERLVTFPIETILNGASKVRRVRSNSIQGLSTVWVEFDWGTEIYLARQIVTEKLQAVTGALPPGVDRPVLAPVTSIMGEIMLVGMTANETPPMELRAIADFDVRRRVLSVPGVSQVLVYGGETQEFQVQLDPYRLEARDITVREVVRAVEETNENATGGVLVQSGQEYLIRGLGRARGTADLENTVVALRGGTPVLVGDVADVRVAPAFRIGTASINDKDGVILVIAKQPEANTLELTRLIEARLEEMRSFLPPDIRLHTDIFRQADFIQVAIDNVVRGLRDGAVLVILVLFLFLLNLRTTFISVVAIPLSLVVAFLVLKIVGQTINTMTLGGMAIAIGVLVDDAIIYVENVFRRVKENRRKPERERRTFDETVAAASNEIRSPIAMATFIVVAVFIPLFFLGGVEGRMLRPLGIAYVVAVLASLLVAVTVTPAMSSYLLRGAGDGRDGDSWVVRRLKTAYEPGLRFFLRRRTLTVLLAGILVLVSLAMLPFLGRAFLPEFNEGTLNISMATLPGTSLEESDAIGSLVESILLAHPAVVSTARRTGRTELDEHSLGSHAHEMEVNIDLRDISKEELLGDLRRDLGLVPGTNITMGQPISHRIDHMLSGTRANIAVKIFGPDLYGLRRVARLVESEMENVRGIVDLSVDLQADVPQVRIRADRGRMAAYGLRIGDMDEHIDAAFLGIRTSEIFEGEHRHQVVVRYGPRFRDDLEGIRRSLLDTPTGARIPLDMVADVSIDRGPNYISRERVERKIVVQANVAGRDLRSTVEDTRARIAANVPMPEGYHVEFGGQFESEEQATRTVLLLSLVSIAAILVTLYIEFGSFRQAILVMVNLPLALIGGIMSVHLSGGVLSIASLVGFITLFGIAVRNGILMVSHFNHLIDDEEMAVDEAVLRGSMERLSPILMTALTTGLALLPLALSGDKPGSEIESPMAFVILGGLLTATFLNLVVVPVLYLRWGRATKG